jgi:hypothetical protein
MVDAGDMAGSPSQYLLTALTAVGVLLLAAVPAGAATTIGSDLASVPVVGLKCGECTVSQRSLPGRQVTAPTDGVIVRWRIRVGAFSVAQHVKLRVIRGIGAASTGVGSSQSEHLPLSGIYTFDTRLPVSAGDFIGIDCCTNPGNFFRRVTGASRDTWGPPPLADGETRLPSDTLEMEAMINADIEPDADADGYGDETQDGCVGQTGLQGGCDNQSPDTTITRQPKKKTEKKQAKFEFESSDPGAFFECSLDGAAFMPCASPEDFKVGRGRHNFSIRAEDSAGNVDPTPATRSWKIRKKKK